MTSYWGRSPARSCSTRSSSSSPSELLYKQGPDTEPLHKKLDKLRRYADEVMAKTVS